MRRILIRAVRSSFPELLTGLEISPADEGCWKPVLKDQVRHKTALGKPRWSPGERFLHRYTPELVDFFQSQFCAHIPSQEPNCLLVFGTCVERGNPVGPGPSLGIPTAPGLPELLQKNASDSKSANYKVPRKCTCSAPFITYASESTAVLQCVLQNEKYPTTGRKPLSYLSVSDPRMMMSHT